MLLTAQVKFVFCSYSAELNRFSKFYPCSYKLVLRFCIALRIVLGFYCKNICLGFHSNKADFLAYEFMVLEYCPILRW